MNNIILIALILANFALDAQNTIFISQPVSESEFKNIFGQDKILTKENKSILEEKIPKEVFKTSYVEKGYSKEDLIKHLRWYNESRDLLSYFILIGHNDKGVFYLPNGESIQLKEIEEYLQGFGKRAIIISCNSDEFLNQKNIGLNFKLNYSEAFELVSNIETHTSTCSRFLQSPKSMDEDVTKIIKKFKVKGDVDKTISLAGKTIVGGGVIYTIVEVLNDESKEKKMRFIKCKILIRLM